MLKKIFCLLITVGVFTSCGLYNSGSINDLQLGATKQEVDSRFGYPLRMLSMGNVGGVYSEVYEYKIRSSVYALEYVGNRLNHVEFMYEYDDYYPNTPPPSYPNRPNRPGGGGSNVKPPSNNGNNRPESNRPGSGGTGIGRPPTTQEKPNTSTKPAEPAKPETGTGTGRPSTGRPTSVSRESSTTSTSTTTTGRGSSSSETSKEETNSTTNHSR